MIKGILFDFDGTLSYRVKSAYLMYRHMLHEIFPDMDVHSVDFEAKVQRCMLWDEYGSINKRHVLTMIQKKWKPDLDIEHYVKVWYDNFYRYQEAMPDSYEVLEKLKQHYKLGIVSNGPLDSQAIKIRQLDMYRYFDTVLISGEFGVAKPDPKIYQAAAEQLGLKCCEVAYVGDTFDTDILGAVRAGMMPLWFCYEHRSEAEYPMKQITSFRELEDMFLIHDEWNRD